MATPQYTLTDYVRWAGCATFEERPFTDADALVFCDVIYFEIFSAPDAKGRTLKDLIDAAPVDDMSIVKRVGGGIRLHSDFIRAVAASRRFGSVILRDYAETLDYEHSIQFAAGAFQYKEMFNFIAYRGTDDTIAGWKEDFMIAFTNTAAQEMSLNFAVSSWAEGLDNYMGGHSKGGNLVLYAAAMLPEELRDQLVRVYDLDGPGFCPEVFDLEKLVPIRDRTTFIMPEFDVIGKLFEPDIPDTRIVASNETMVMQHELLSWGVNENGLDTVSENDPRANNINRIIDEWVENISQEDRQTFVNELFDALGANGAKTMTEIMEGGVNGFEKILFEVSGTSQVTKKAMASLPEQAFFGNTIREFKEKGLWKFLQTNALVRAVLLIATGILFIFASESIFAVTSMLLLTGLTVLQIGLTVKRLKENHWKLNAIRDRLHLCAIMIVLCVCLYVKDQATYLLGSIIFAIAAFLIAVQSGLLISDKSRPFYRRLLNIAECISGIIYGLSFLVIPQSTMFAYAISIGNALIGDGIIRIIFILFDTIRERKKSVSRVH